MAISATQAPASRPVGLAANDLPRRFGRYVLLRRIAKGGMGEVMLAATLGLEGAERPVIVKTIRTEHRTDQSFKARFLDEARVQAQLEHSGVAKIIEATTDEESGEPYVVVEYVEGRSLGDLRSRALSTGQRLGWHEAVAIAQLGAEALAHVHDRQDAQGKPLAIVHRDLSPQNVMVSYGGEVKIIDFGTARGENRRCHTVAGVVFAKPGYTAPEVANGDPGDFRVDLYALGVMLWELCAGRRFLQGEASDHMAAVAKNERNLPPIAALSEAPRALDEVIEKLTAFDRAERFEKTHLAARELAALLGAAPPLESGERGVRPRVAALAARLFDGEAARTRREFSRLVADARKLFGSMKTPQVPEPVWPKSTESVLSAMRDEKDGLLPGTRYRLLGVLGKGARTVVHEAEHADLGRRVALKMPEGAGSATEQAADRIRQEAIVLAKVQVPGVVRIIDVGRTAEGVPFSVLERCEGQTLGARLRADAALGWRESLEITDRILAAIERVHGRGIIHRDIKPDNVFVGPDGDVTILDFGIALDRESGADLETPPPGRPEVALYGTPEYMSPEQAARPDEVDERGDVYAAGVILYEMLTGRLPFAEASAVKLLEAKAQGNPEPPSERAQARAIPRAVDDLTLRALSRHPSLRFANAAEMRAAIAGALSEPIERRTKRRAAGLGIMLAAMACAGAVIAASATRIGTEARGLAARAGIGIAGEEVKAQPEPPPTAPLDVLADAPASSPEPAVEAPAAAPEPAKDAAQVIPTVADVAAVDGAKPEPIAGPASVETEKPEAAEKKPPRKVRRAEKKKPEADHDKQRTRKRKGKTKKAVRD
jgi:eukaryotic-like serine/threonine-protein kinase